MNKYKELETDNLLLQKITLEDAKIFWDKIFNNLENYKFYHQVMFISFRDYEQIVNSYNEKYSKGNFFKWKIVLKEGNVPVGIILLHSVDNINNKARLGYIVSNDYQNRGIATEACNRILKFVFEELKIHRLETTIVVSNKASEKVIEKLGMNLESIEKESFYLDGNYYDEKKYVLLINQYNINN